MSTNGTRDRAIVIGGSIGGLLAATALAGYFEKVTVIERDRLPDKCEPRRGVPQGKHAHALLAGGLKAIEEFFPGFSDEMADLGAVRSDPTNCGTWHMEGGRLMRAPFGATGILMSRPFLEFHLRRRAEQVPNIETIDSTCVRNLIFDANKVRGLVTDAAEMQCNLVVDASGRGCKGPKWFEENGFPKPREENVEVQLTYTTRMFERRPADLNGDDFTVVTPTLEGKRGGVVLAAENNRWLVTLWGHFGESAPRELDGYVEFARSLPAPIVYDLVRDASPIGEAEQIRFPASVRRRYEKLKRSPDGYLAFGDAICSFNPIYGQGMSSAALQATALKHALSRGDNELPKRFYQLAAKVIDIPWDIAVGSDLRMPEVQGDRTKAVRFINWYMSHLHRAAHRDAQATLAFIRVAQLMDTPSSLFAPRIAAKVLRQAVIAH